MRMKRLRNLTHGMDRHYKHPGMICGLCLLSVIMAACATLWDPAEHGVRLAATGTDKARITHVDVFQKGRGLHLVGEVDIDTNAPMLMNLPGHVDVLVESHAGGAEATYRPDAYRHIHDHDVTYQRFSFSVEIPGFPPRGSEIHLIYHEGGGTQMHGM